MKSLFRFCLFWFCLLACLGRLAAEGLTKVTIGDEEISGIKKVTLRPDGRVMILYGASGGQYPADKLPKEFLTSWGITLDKISSAKQEDLENAIRSGKFRVVDGVVYDMRQRQTGWTTFRNAKLIQRLHSGAALVDPNPEDRASIAVVHVVNLPETVADTDRFSFIAKQMGTYEYENKNGDMRVVASYDLGRICERGEIPDDILKNGKIAAVIATSPGAQRDVLAELPDNEQLLCNGTGFFISDDGYLITNDHVVRGVHRVKVRLKSALYDAEIIKTDPEADLALLKANVAAPALPLGLSKGAALGDEVFTIGFPNVDLQGLEPKYTDGRISSLSGLHDDPTRYQISVAVQPGNSGGALLDKSGQVVGVIVSRINDLAVLESSGSLPQNINYAIKVSLLRSFLKPLPEVSGKLKSMSPETDRKITIANAQAATVMVLGYK